MMPFGFPGSLYYLQWLPTLRAVVAAGTYMGDLDHVGEMFLNFMLHKNLQQLCGVDLTKYCGTKIQQGKGLELKKVWEVWKRAAMGLRSSPYQPSCPGNVNSRGIHLGRTR